MDLEDFINQYWDYYLALEDEFINTRNFLTVDKDNFKSFSTEYLKLLQTVCSEIDVLSKEFCEYLKSPSKADSIGKYAYYILKKQPKIKFQKVYYTKGKIKFTPWEKWKGTKGINKNDNEFITGISPNWWNLYNNVKHKRTSYSKTYEKPYYKLANQENLLNAYAGLFVLEMYFYKLIVLDISKDFPLYPNERSKLFDMGNWDPTHIYPNEMISFIEN